MGCKTFLVFVARYSDGEVQIARDAPTLPPGVSWHIGMRVWSFELRSTGWLFQDRGDGFAVRDVFVDNRGSVLVRLTDFRNGEIQSGSVHDARIFDSWKSHGWTIVQRLDQHGVVTPIVADFFRRQS